MKDLTLSISLPGTTTRQDMDRAGRDMAATMVRELGHRRAAYRELYLEAAAKDGETKTCRLFPHAQGPGKLPWHVTKLLAELPVSSPITGLTIRLSGLLPAALEQLTVFGVIEPKRQNSIEEVLEKVKAVVPLSSLGEDRREKMLSFYDPFRQEI